MEQDQDWQNIAATDAGYRAQPSSLVTQIRMLVDVLLDRRLDSVNRLLKPADGLLQAGCDGSLERRLRLQRLLAIALLLQDVLQVLASSQQRFQFSNRWRKWLPDR